MRQDAKANAPKRIPIQHILGPHFKKDFGTFLSFLFVFYSPL